MFNAQKLDEATKNMAEQIVLMLEEDVLEGDEISHEAVQDYVTDQAHEIERLVRKMLNI